jgi:hypothetical protein
MFRKKQLTPAETAELIVAKAALDDAKAELKAVGASNRALRAEYRRRMASASTKDERKAAREWLRAANDELNGRKK